MNFAKIALETIYMLQTLKTWSHFFYKGSFHLLKIFLELISMVKVHEIAKMCQNLDHFSFYYCKSLSNTFLSWGTPKWCPRKLRFESCGYFDVIFDLKGIKNKISNFWHNETPYFSCSSITSLSTLGVQISKCNYISEMNCNMRYLWALFYINSSILGRGRG